MGIEIKIFEKKWQLHVKEMFQFDNKEDMDDVLKKLLIMKDKHTKKSKQE